MWFREPCSVWLLGGKGAHNRMLWGKNLEEQLGSKTWGSFLQAAEGQGHRDLAPDRFSWSCIARAFLRAGAILGNGQVPERR